MLTQFNSKSLLSILYVGINNNTIASTKWTPWNTSLHSGDTTDVWISYNSTTKNLSVSWKYQNSYGLEEHTSLSLAIDLTRVLSEWVTIGFSAATGSFGKTRTLLSWEFNSTCDRAKENNSKKTRASNIEDDGIEAIGSVLRRNLAVHEGVVFDGLLHEGGRWLGGSMVIEELSGGWRPVADLAIAGNGVDERVPQ
ncbi:hypothetical protein Ahy_A04g020221 [Arachis hypogaea]|uniref:Legume lectin domain-containing protein n=1 Tax=Arachis hypogaea TaxID=3818 RepID=A0A445DHE9_ARAHY|nr:hypothetical protein Ahy_A04g020221 [Arachis hypogaea]